MIIKSLIDWNSPLYDKLSKQAVYDDCFNGYVDRALYADPDYDGHDDCCGGHPAIFLVEDDLGVLYYLCYDCLPEIWQEAVDAILADERADSLGHPANWS